MWELDQKEDWMPKNWCFQTVVLEKTLESPLDCKEIKSVDVTVNQPWMFTGRTDAEAEAPMLWPPDVKSQLVGKGPDAGKEWRQKKRQTDNEMVWQHHWLNGHEFEQTPRDTEGRGSLTCCSPWAAKSRTRLNKWTTTWMSPTSPVKEKTILRLEGKANPISRACKKHSWRKQEATGRRIVKAR